VRAAALDHAVAVGLSGGADSLALMAALVAEGHDVLALCVDHGLQDGSRAQAERAAEQARKLGARARVLNVEAGAMGQKSMEAAARVARYRALAAACAAEELEVAVAHTADDQAETLLLGALRGRVTGMSERSEGEGAGMRCQRWLKQQAMRRLTTPPCAPHPPRTAPTWRRWRNRGAGGQSRRGWSARR